VRRRPQVLDRVRQLPVQEARTVMETLHVVREPEHGRALRGLVRADSLEHTGAVVETVNPDVNGRVRPVDELAVHPDLRGLLHGAPPFASVTKSSRDSSTTSSTRPRVRRTSSGGASETRCDSEPAPAQTVWCRSIVRSTRTPATRPSGNGDTAPGGKPVAARTSSGSAVAARRAPMSRATFPVSTLRSPGTRVTTGDASHRRTIDVTTWPSV